MVCAKVYGKPLGLLGRHLDDRSEDGPRRRAISGHGSCFGVFGAVGEQLRQPRSPEF